MHKALVTTLGVAGLVLSYPIAAQEMPSEEVQFGDLDLRSDAGVKRFDTRIRSAVVRLCSGSSALPLDEASEIRRCHSTTFANVQPIRDEVIDNAQRRGRVDIVRLTIRKGPANQ